MTKDARARHFARISLAILRGMELVPDPSAPGTYFKKWPGTGKTGCGTVAAAWIAEFEEELAGMDEGERNRLFTSAEVYEFYPELRQEMPRACPAGVPGCPEGGNSLEAKIIHLEDVHAFRRAEVVRWLEDLGL